MGDLMPNGLVLHEVDRVTRVIDLERWVMAEERTAELIACIQPNQRSEERRNAVANYVQQLVAKCISCEVFTFGSVPLKTYLPDGDIDLTTFSDDENLKDTWANEVRDALENVERSENAEFQVKEVQYIQAEVKIIKCLVENIVVDISFNQVGGLCTLCFLEEIDHLIGQNHLFKRSIILIKAWCYYESRILGAHHGLISTYALETLVLYIFHVFNNSFAGPLEVLYRFLEFFSNFDWDNFCVSLWGPVPISSLPDMIAEPPRKDGGELLLDKRFLDACTAIYGVSPGNHENHSLPFVSKHFNVIDPLRINNNLGRSVSKGNFFRIRSAFAFGAKKLVKLLECPKENLIAEVNQFFLNTWERHGSGLWPDAPGSSIRNLRSLENVPVEESKSGKSTANNKPKRANESHTANNLAFQGSIPQVMNIITQHTQNVHKASNPSVVYRVQNQKNYGNHIGSRESDQLERSTSSHGSVQPGRTQKILKPDHSVDEREARGKFHFARTQSSPELNETSAEDLSHLLRSTVLNSHARLDYGNRRKNTVSEVSSGPRLFFDNPYTLKHNTSHQSLEASADTNSVSNSCHEDAGYSTMGEELPSVSEALELRQDMHQGGQDLINMMTSTLHNTNGQVQLPVHLASSHLSIPFSAVLASAGYSQRDLARIVPNNITFIDPSWGSGMQLHQGFVPSHPSPYFPVAESLSSNPEDMVESGYQLEDADHGMWHEHDSGSSKEFDQQKVSEHRGQIRDNHANVFPYQTSRGNDINSNDRDPNSRSLRMSQSGSSRSKSSSESSRDGSSTRVPKSARDKWERKPASSTVVNNTYGRVKSGWQFESSSRRVSPQEDEESGSWNSDCHQSLGYEPAQQVTRSDPIVPVAPVIVDNSRQRTENSGVVPVAFYPTGPPVPFLTMLPFPVYNFQSNSSNDGSSSHFDKDDGVDDSRFSASDIDFNSEVQKSLATPKITAPETSEEPKSDILHSDFTGHWQNLQYGRLCQTNQNNGAFVCPPLIAPPGYLQGHFPLEGPGRSVSTNLNIFPQMMSYGSHLVPVGSLQQVTDRTSGVFQRYGNVAPRFRGGTGTYLPNPKAPYRDRQFPSNRNQRGNYNGDREGAWISTKNQAAGRTHWRNHADKRSHHSQNNYFGASSNSERLGNIPYGMYSMHNASLNGVGPNGPAAPTVMFYPYGQGAVHGSSSDINEDQPSRDGNVERVHERRQGTYRGTSLLSSPDQPSSPHIQRSTTQRNYQLKDEDFPPLSSTNEGDNVASDYDYDNRPHYQSFFPTPHS